MTHLYPVSSQHIQRLRLGLAEEPLSFSFCLGQDISKSDLREAMTQLVATESTFQTRFVKQVGLKVPVAEVKELNPEEIGRLVDLAETATPRFALDALPLFSWSLTTQPTGEAVVSLAVASILMDRTGLLLAAEKLWKSVGGECLEKPDIAYDAYAEWQHDVVHADDGYAEEGQLFWADRPLPDLAKLPAWYLAEAPGCHTVEKHFASSGKVAVFAAFQWVVQRFALNNNGTVWVEADGRTSEELQLLLGRFAKWVPVSAVLDSSERWSSFAEKCEQAWDQAGQWADFFGMSARSEPTGENPGLRFSFLDTRVSDGPTGWWKCPMEQTSPTVLACSAVEDKKTLTLQLSSDRLAPQMLEILAQEMAAALEVGESHPQSLLADFPARTAHQHPLLNGWRPKANTHPQPVEFLHEAFGKQVEKFGHAPALEFEGKVLTYSDLDTRANQLANLLVECGLERDQLVGICMERGFDWVATMLAILKAGGAFLPLNPELPDQRLQEQVDDAKPFTILAPTHHAARIQGTPVLTPDQAANQATHFSPIACDPQQLAYALYTSGSTGKPKAALLTHAALSGYVQGISQALGFQPKQRLGLFSTLNADLGYTMVMPALTTGACLVFFSEESALQPQVLAQPLKRRSLDFLKIVPSHLQALLASGEASLLPEQALLLGGEATGEALIATILKLKPHLKIWNHYGPTETCVGVLAGEMRQPIAGRFAMGRPLGEMAIQLLDPHGHPVPPGVSGHLVISGPTLARGYLKRPGLTAKHFRPAAHGQRCYFTGDHAVITPQGALLFLGRRDHQVKIHGNRVELGEIEAILKMQPEIENACAIILRDGERVQVAAYWQAKDEVPDSFDPSQHASNWLLPHMRPAFWMRLAQLPLNANGKVDRQALPRIEPRVSDRNAAPQTPVQATLASIWASVLGREQVGIHENFFQLGGDSILSIQIMAAAKQAGYLLVPKQIFDHPTVAQLAEVVGKAVAGEDLAEADGPTTPLTPIQKWFFSMNLSHPHHWNMSFLAKPDQPLDPLRVEAACQKLWVHHAALRLIFPQGAEQAHYLPAETAVPVHRVRLSGEASSQQEEIQQAAATYQDRVRLETGPLFQVVSMELPASGEQRLLFILHHLIVDAVSWRILAEDFETAYANPTQKLPPATVSFQTRARRLQTQQAVQPDAHSGATTPQPRTLKPFPQDGEGPDVEMYEHRLHGELSVQDTSAFVAQLSQAYQAKIEEALLAALAETLVEWNTAQAVLIDVEGHGRDSLGSNFQDLSRTVGWFTTHTPLLLEKTGTLETMLQNTRAMLHQAQAATSRVGEHRLVYAHRTQPAQISFNYWGNMERQFASERLLKPAPESLGPLHHPQNQRPYLLRFNAQLSEGKLKIALSYNQKRHHAETIQNLVAQMLAKLRLLTLEAEAGRWGGWTYEALAHSGLNPQAYRELAARAANAWGGNSTMEYAFRLTPLQAGIFYQTLRNPEKDVYFRQMAWSIKGDLNPEFFEQAWREEVASQATFRTGFFWDQLPHPLQLIANRTHLDFQQEDWQELPNPEEHLERRRFGELAKGFCHQQPPLMRMVLAQVSPDRFYFIWSYHHLILDGWSKYLALGRVYQRYERMEKGQGENLPPSPPFRHFLEWLQGQDPASAAAFWRKQLAGFSGARPLLTETQPRQDGVFSELPLVLDDAETQALVVKARQLQLTMNTLVQGAWCAVLAQQTGDLDVSFGSTVAGRPPLLDQVEQMIGPFINTQPVRMRMQAEESMVSIFQRLQVAQVEARAFEYASLTDIKQWCGLAAGKELFESLVIFYNYPKSKEVHHLFPNIQMSPPQFIEESDFKLGLVATLAEGGLKCGIRFDSGSFTHETVQIFLDQLQKVFRAFLQDETQSLAQLLAGMENPPPGDAHALYQEQRLVRGRRRRAIEIPGGV